MQMISRKGPTVDISPYVYRTSIAPTRFVNAAGVRFAYRVIGQEDGIPLIVLNGFRGAMDDWDPALIDIIATERKVVLFDGAGIGRSNGEAPSTIAGIAEIAAAFVSALGFRHIDLLGYSMGGYAAQALTLDHPKLLRRLILAATGPGYVAGAMPDARIRKVATRRAYTAENVVYLLFHNSPESQAAGIEFLARLRLRRGYRLHFVNARATAAQLAAEAAIATPESSLLPRLAVIRQPTLVASGDRDRMIPPYQSYAMAEAISDAKLVIYPNSGHGFLFQYPQAFGWEVLQFLED